MPFLISASKPQLNVGKMLLCSFAVRCQCAVHVKDHKAVKTTADTSTTAPFLAFSFHSHLLSSFKARLRYPQMCEIVTAPLPSSKIITAPVGRALSIAIWSNFFPTLESRDAKTNKR